MLEMFHDDYQDLVRFIVVPIAVTEEQVECKDLKALAAACCPADMVGSPTLYTGKVVLSDKIFDYFETSPHCESVNDGRYGFIVINTRAGRPAEIGPYMTNRALMCSDIVRPFLFSYTRAGSFNTFTHAL
tara:strand:- start:289 stop:678 length:390 start_codon:yes stop_codon:yes gene_type:complete